MLEFFKKHAAINPYIGLIINYIPFTIRPGVARSYRESMLNQTKYVKMSGGERRAFVFERISSLVNFSYHNVVFYKDFYTKNGFSPSDLKVFDDIRRIPIISKSQLNNYSLSDRTAKAKGGNLVNTGGSSGETLSFYISDALTGNEWAHMHTIWSKLDYNFSDLKLVFAGRSDVQNFVQYDFVRNQFSVDIYSDYAKVAPKLKRVLTQFKIKYLHGYPSAIFTFANYCKNHDADLLDLLKINLRGVFLSSEYPYAVYRDYIEEVFKVSTISWYGHTERAVLAYEDKVKGTYSPYQSYGLAECVEDFLIGTSYYNYASPLIRYNTNDIVSDCNYEGGLLSSFTIKEGRVGEFVVDLSGASISLTSLIFGRHHLLFNSVSFIQVKQIQSGFLEIFYVSEILESSEAALLFDSANLNFVIKFTRISEPFRSVSGKVNLLVK